MLGFQIAKNESTPVKKDDGRTREQWTDRCVNPNGHFDFWVRGRNLPFLDLNPTDRLFLSR